MRIVVDVMGGDHGCEVVIEGVKYALQKVTPISKIFLVGQQDAIKAALVKLKVEDARVQVVHASEVLTMEDKPVVGLRRKKDCSIARAVELIKNGEAEALISPGNTGGVVAASTIKLRTLPGVERPAIAAVIPTPLSEFVLLDSGGSVECRPIHLLQYAVMGSAYAREVLGKTKPRVGLLSIGTEETKGNELTFETYKLCKRINLNFIGHVEGHDLFADRVDVVVCDGFVGNVVLKTCESLASCLVSWVKKELVKNPMRMFGAFLAKGAFKSIKQRMDPDTHGGAPLLGLNGTVMIAHGAARQNAIMCAIRTTSQAVHHHLDQVMTQEIAAANACLSLPSVPAGTQTSQ